MLLGAIFSKVIIEFFVGNNLVGFVTRALMLVIRDGTYVYIIIVQVKALCWLMRMFLL